MSPAPVTTLSTLRLLAARLAGHAFSSTCSAAGQLHLLIDATLADVAGDKAFLQNSWLYRPDAAAGDRTRVVTDDGYAVEQQALVPTRRWSVAPSNGEAYQVFPLLPPVDVAGVSYSWTRAVQDGLRECYFVDEIVLGRGTARGDRRFPLDVGEVIMIAAVVVAGGSGATITPPSGWTLIRRTNQGTDVALATYSRRARLDDGLEWTWTFDSSRAAAGGIVAYVDANPTNPVNTDGGNSGTSATTATAPAVTPTVTDTRVLRVYGASGAAAFSIATDTAERFDVEARRPGASVAAMVADADRDAATSTGTKDATLSTARAWVAQTIALAPFASREIAYVTSSSAQNGSGATTLDIPRPSTVTNDDWRPTEASVRGVFTRTFDADQLPHDVDWSTNGRWWDVHEDEDGVDVELGPRSPSTSEIVVVKVHRPYPRLVADADETTCDEERAAQAARWKVYAFLNSAPPTRGMYAVELASALEDFRRADAVLRPGLAIVGA